MVINKVNTGPILQNIRKTLNINGKILKVYAKTNHASMSRIKIISNEFETIIDTELNNIVNIFYPFNNLEESRLPPETTRTDYFYIYDKVGIEVTNLNQGDIIEDIKIFYE